MIDSTAIVRSGAKIAPTAEIGPYCIVGENVELADGVKLHSHVCVSGRTRIGQGTEIYPFAAIGYAPQDKKYQGEDSELIIGCDNVIREHVTIHPGTRADKGIMKTIIGDRCLLMVGAHIAHDCVLGNEITLANGVTLAGHVRVDDMAVVGGLTGVHQFVRIGELAMVGGCSGVAKDIIPYGHAVGNRTKLKGINITGMRRHNFDKAEIAAVQRVYDIIFAAEANEPYLFDERIALIGEEYSQYKSVRNILEFLSCRDGRAVCMA